jgi:nitroreductase
MTQSQAAHDVPANDAAIAQLSSAERRAVRLPSPQQEGGMPLFNALRSRRSTRDYSNRAITLGQLSTLLWAGFGVNRPNDGRTAPYWRHIMVIDLYVAVSDGVWLYEPQSHSLWLHLNEDIRAHTGQQEFVGQAPLDLIYVAHGERMTDVSPEESRLFAAVDSAFIGQNVYLFCASEGLGSVFRGAINYPALEKRLMLPKEQFVTFAQTVGHSRD